MHPFGIVPALFILGWLAHYEYDVNTGPSYDVLASDIERDYKKFLKSFAFGGDNTLEDCVRVYFTTGECDQ